MKPIETPGNRGSSRRLRTHLSAYRGPRLTLFAFAAKILVVLGLFVACPAFPLHAQRLISPNSGTLNISTERWTDFSDAYENQAAGVININGPNGLVNNSGTLDNHGAITNNAGGQLVNMWGSITNKTGATLTNYGTVTDNGMSITNESGATLGNYGTWYGYGPLTNDGTITNYSGATFDNSNSLTNNGTLSNAGTFLNNDWSTLTNTGMLTTSGTFTNSSAATLTNSNALTSSGTFNNSGALDNSGSLTISSGGIFNHNTTATFGGTGTIVLGGTLNNTSGNAFDITTLSFTGGTFNSNGTGSVSIGTASVAAGQTGTIQGTKSISLTTANVIGTLNISAVLSGTGSLTKTGAGTLTLSGTNTYSGGTTVSAGTLQGNTTSLQGDITDNAQVVFDQAVDGTYSGTISGTGSVTKTGAGTLTITGSCCIDGGLTIAAGTLVNDGTIENDAGVAVTNTAGGTLTNVDTLGNHGTLTNAGTLNNDNGGWLFNADGGILTNTGTLNNLAGAQLTNQDGSSLINNGTLTNSGWLGNDAGSTLTNNATLTNDNVLVNFATLQNNGALTNNVGGTITNSATLVNNLGATLTNNGTLTNSAGGTFTNNGTFTNGGTFTNNGTLKGTGTILGDITNSGTIAPGNSIGTMTITGNYTHGAGAFYQVEVNAAGQSDKLVVTGTATLNGGTVAVLAESGAYRVSTDYTILTAGAVTGTFGSVTSNLAFLTPSLSYDATSVFLRLTRNSTSFADVALPGNERAVASAIDRISPSATGDMADVINTMLGLSTEGVRRAYDQMGGITHNSLIGAVFFSSGRYMDILSDRMGSLLTGGRSSGFANGSVMLASRSDVGSDAGNTVLAALKNVEDAQKPRQGFWMRGYAGTADRHGIDISSRYNYDLAGIVTGFDRNVSDPLLLGVSLGYTHTKVTMKDLSDFPITLSFPVTRAGNWGPWGYGTGGNGSLKLDKAHGHKGLAWILLFRIGEHGYAGQDTCQGDHKRSDGKRLLSRFDGAGEA